MQLYGNRRVRLQPWVPVCRALERRPLDDDAAADPRGRARTPADPRSGGLADGRGFVRGEQRLYRSGGFSTPTVPAFTVLVAESWDGRRWSLLPLERLGMSADLEAITCPSATECIAVGQAGTGLIAVTLADGLWSELTVPTPLGASFPALSSVSCSSPSSCMAVGYRHQRHVAERTARRNL